MHTHLKNELNMVMWLAGTPDIRSIKRDFIERAEAFLAVGVASWPPARGGKPLPRFTFPALRLEALNAGLII